MTEFLPHKGWAIAKNYIGEFEATAPDFDPENPQARCAFAPTLEAIHFEIDVRIEDQA